MSEAAARETLSNLTNSELQELVVTGFKVRQYFECVNVALKQEIEQLKADKEALLEFVHWAQYSEVPASTFNARADDCLKQIGGTQ